ncbi:helix-turn-helix transcriptional regulator [Selenomonas sp. oral taxon 137]|uniref:helix-turn-helix domain-containing protein n=1 Tax=Selenomonas sp. oral taxon 137 TaxID=712531 RepID=UPI0008FBC7B0
MSFGLILKQARTHKKLTQIRLSELLSVSPQTISGWERNVYFPEQDKLLRLAKILDLSLGILTENSPERRIERNTISYTKTRRSIILCIRIQKLLRSAISLVIKPKRKSNDIIN